MDASVPGYVLDGLIGGTASSTVHRGEHVESGRAVAVKRVTTTDPSAASRLRSEAATLASLAHPNLLRILEVVAVDGGLAVVTPLADRSLADELARSGAMPAAEVAELGAALASGLAAAHDEGIVHRDVKPANVLFDREGVALLADFGAASVHGSDAANIVGTAEYLDPATVEGRAPDATSDVYALGVTLYELLTGVPPYAGSTPEATLRAADRGVHVPLRQAAPTTPPSLAAAVERAMARDPERRFATARDLRQALEAARLDATAGPGTSSPPPPTTAPVPPTPPRTGQPSPPATPGERSGGTRHFGPRPVVTREAAKAGSSRNRWLIIAAIVVVIAIPLGTLALTRDGGADPEEPEPDVAATETVATLCDGATPPAVDEDSTLLSGDLTGEGCETFATWSAGVLAVHPPSDEAPIRFRMGEADDLPVLGDWDCDGVDTPGIYRPTTGEVFLFDGLAGEAGDLTSRPAEDSGTTGGSPTVTTGQDGCDTVRVSES